MVSGSSLRERLLFGSAWAFGGKVATAIAWLMVNGLLARILSPREVGVYFIGFSIVSLGALVGVLGLNAAVIRFVAESVALNRMGRARRAVGMVFTLGAAGALGMSFTYLIVGDVMAESLFDARGLAAVTGLLAGWIAVLTFQNLLAETFRGFHDIRQATIIGGLLPNVLLAGCLVAVWLVWGQTTLTTVLLLAVGSGLSSALLAGWILRGKVASLSMTDVEKASEQLGYREVLRVAWPLLISRLAVFLLTQADIWILAIFRSEQEVAMYGAASRLAVGTILMVTQVLYAVLPPLVAEKHAMGQTELLERLLRAGATATAIVALPMVMLFMLLPGQILALVYGEFYASGGVILGLLSIGLFVNAATGLHGYVLTMTGHERTQLVVFAIGGAFNIVLCVFGAVYWGVYGVAVAAMIAMVLQCVLEVIVIRYRLGIWTHSSISSIRDIRRLTATRIRGGV